MSQAHPVARPARTSLRARMTLGFTVSLLSFLLLACIADFLWARHAAQKDAARRVQAAAQLVAHEWDEAQDDTSSSGIERVIEASRVDALQHGWLNALDDVSIVLLDSAGQVRGVSRHPYPQTAKGGQWLTAQASAPTGIVFAGIDKRELDKTLHARTLLLLSFAMACTLAAGGAAWVLVGRTLRPIGALADQADTASADPLRARLLSPSDDAEVRHLVGTLNNFLTRLNENTREREQFYAAAAHELRTPLAVLSGSIEVAQSRPRTPEETTETLSDLREQTQRLIKLTEDLLTLNRLHTVAPGTISEDTDYLDVADYCERALSAFAPAITARGLRVETRYAPTSCDVFTSPAHLAILTRNLIENATRYADANGILTITVEPKGGVLRLCLTNTYSAAASLDTARLFEPFYRADPSRAAATGGNGLGLAICKRVADANGWLVTITHEAKTVTINVAFSR